MALIVVPDYQFGQDNTSDSCFILIFHVSMFCIENHEKLIHQEIA